MGSSARKESLGKSRAVQTRIETAIHPEATTRIRLQRRLQDTWVRPRVSAPSKNSPINRLMLSLRTAGSGVIKDWASTMKSGKTIPSCQTQYKNRSGIEGS